ncbi:hypothetical protein NQL31_007148 [Lotmaria passim]
MAQTPKARFLRGYGAPAPLRQGCIYCVLMGFALCLLLIFVGVFTPLIIFHNRDRSYGTKMAHLEYALAVDAAQSLRNFVSVATSVTQAHEGYVIGRMRVLPNLSLPPAERIIGQNFSDFTDFARSIIKYQRHIASSMLVPGGVYTEMFPVANDTYMRDMFDPDDYSQAFLPTPQQSMLDGKVAYIGPFLSTVDFLRGYWGLSVRRPVYNRTSFDGPVKVSRFWGFTQTVLNFSAILAEQPFKEALTPRSKKYRNVDYVITVRDPKTGKLQLMASSMHGLTEKQLEDFVRLGSSADVTPHHPFTVTVRGRDYGKWLSANNVTTVVATVLAGSLFLLAVFVAALLCCTRVYDGTVHAPKLAPFAMLTVGPCRGEELWELASDQMVEVTDRLGKVLARQMVRHHAYQIQQVHPFTTSYVTRGVAAAVQMAFDTIEELHRHPIDEPLRRLLGDDGRLLLSYAVHWCNDAVVRLDPMEGGYRYEGPDVVYGGRMWAFAAPSVVTASEAALPAARRMSHVRAKLFDSVFLRGVTERQDLYVVWDSTNHKLREAEDFAAEQVRRARLAQREMAEMKGSDADPTKRRLTYSFNQNGYDSSDLDIGSFSGRPRMSGCSGEAAAAVVARASSTSNTNSNSNSNSDRSTPVSAMRSRASATKTTKRDGVAGITAATSMSIIVPTLSMDAPRPSTSVIGPVGAAANPLVFPAVPVKKQERWMVRPPSGCSSSSSSVVVTGNNNNNNSGCSGDAPPHIVTNENNKDTQHDSKTSPCSSGHFSVRVLVYYFYSSYKILFRPLAAPERHNIYRRLVTAFGVPQQGILEHLAARCAIRCLQQSAKPRERTSPQHQEEVGVTLTVSTALPGTTGR